MRALTAWLGERRLTLACGLAAALPVIVAVAEALHYRWVPLDDSAVIALRSWDVLTGQSPLVGQYSISTAEEVGRVFSPGPLLYWLHALPVRAFGVDAMPVTMGLVNVGSIMGAVALARRRGGLVLMFATALAIALMCRSVPTELLRTPVNNTAPVIPGTLLVFLAWSHACGELRLLPLTVLVASYVTQTHLSSVPSTVAVLAVAAIWLVYERSARTRPSRALAARRLRSRRSSSAGGGDRRFVLAAVVVGLVCWSAPIADQIVHEPGNLERLRRTFAADRPTLGAEAARHAAVRAFGVPPWWLRRNVDAQTRFLDVANSPPTLGSLTFLLLAGGLAAVLVAGVRRRRRAAATAASLALVLIPALAALAGATPEERIFILGYTMMWGSPAGMFAWLALGFGAVTLLAPAARRAAPELARRRRPRAAAASWGALALVAVVAGWVAIIEPATPNRWLFAPARATSALLESEFEPGQTVFLAGPTGDFSYQAYPFFAYALRRHGARVLVVPGSVEAVGPYYDVTGRRYERLVRLVDGTPPRLPGGRVLGRIPLPDAPVPRSKRVVTIEVGPGGVGPPQ